MKKFDYADFLRYLCEREEGFTKSISAETCVRELEMDSLETLELLLKIELTYCISIPFQIVKEDMTVDELINEINKIMASTTIVES